MTLPMSQPLNNYKFYTNSHLFSEYILTYQIKNDILSQGLFSSLHKMNDPCGRAV